MIVPLLILGAAAVALFTTVVWCWPECASYELNYWQLQAKGLPERLARWRAYDDAYQAACRAVPRPRVTRKIVVSPTGGFKVATWRVDLMAGWDGLFRVYMDPPASPRKPWSGFDTQHSHTFDTRAAAEAWLKASRPSRSKARPAPNQDPNQEAAKP